MLTLYDRDPDMLSSQMEKLMQVFGVNWTEVEKTRSDLIAIRKLCTELDIMTWQDNLVSGEENHRYLVASSDFNGNHVQ